MIETFREATLLQCGFLEKLLDLDMNDVAAFSGSMEQLLTPSPENKFVYDLAAGRSALGSLKLFAAIHHYMQEKGAPNTMRSFSF